MSKWSDQYKDPRWQKKRLEVMERAGFECEDCGDSSKTLHVHHRYYENNKKPWNYPDECYLCLCNKCHQKRTDATNELKSLLKIAESGEIDAILGYADSTINCYPWCSFDLEKRKSAEYAMGIAAGNQISEDQLYSLANKCGVVKQKDIDDLKKKEREHGKK